MATSAYRSPAFELIHAHDFAIIRRFVDYLSGAARLPNGGAVVRRHDAQQCAAQPVDGAHDRAAGGQAGDHRRGARQTLRPAVRLPGRGRAADMEVLRLSSVSKDEARTVMEYWAASGC